MPTTTDIRQRLEQARERIRGAVQTARDRLAARPRLVDMVPRRPSGRASQFSSRSHVAAPAPSASRPPAAVKIEKYRRPM